VAIERTCMEAYKDFTLLVEEGIFMVGNRAVHTVGNRTPLIRRLDVGVATVVYRALPSVKRN